MRPVSALDCVLLLTTSVSRRAAPASCGRQKNSASRPRLGVSIRWLLSASVVVQQLSASDDSRSCSRATRDCASCTSDSSSSTLISSSCLAAAATLDGRSRSTAARLSTRRADIGQNRRCRRRSVDLLSASESVAATGNSLPFASRGDCTNTEDLGGREVDDDDETPSGTSTPQQCFTQMRPTATDVIRSVVSVYLRRLCRGSQHHNNA